MSEKHEQEIIHLMNESDDMLGLFDSMREAYLAGRHDGMIKAFEFALIFASTIGSSCESIGDDCGFHAAEKIASEFKSQLVKMRNDDPPYE